MKKILKRMGYGALLVLWLGFMCVPAFFCALVANSGELVWGDEPTNQVRFFLMQERDKEGLGVQWTRPVDENGRCLRTTVRYLMFAGEAENQATCQCAPTTPAAELPAACIVPTS